MVKSQPKVTLREVTAKNVRSICELAVNEEQNNYVAPNALAIAEACFGKDTWLRSIYMEESPVGLAVLEIQPETARYFLWRLMIDARYQKLTLGRRAMELLIEHVKTRPNAIEFLTSVVPGEHSPQGFYERLGFELTAEWHEGEAVMRLTL
jgi:diamine N-acetyltransferase